MINGFGVGGASVQVTVYGSVVWSDRDLVKRIVLRGSLVNVRQGCAAVATYPVGKYTDGDYTKAFVEFMFTSTVSLLTCAK